MVDEDSHSTDLSVSGEEGHSTTLLAHYIFGFDGGQSYLATLVTPQNCTKMVRNLTLLYNLYILASDQKKLLFICATVEQLSLQKATF